MLHTEPKPHNSMSVEMLSMTNKVGSGEFADSFEPGEIEQIPCSDLKALDKLWLISIPAAPELILTATYFTLN